MLQPKQENRFEYKGFPCVVLFMPMGYRCGYVGLPKGNKYYEEDYDGIPVSCHWELTYSNNYLFGQDDKDIWWIGFDCGHFNDGIDKDTFNKLYEKELLDMSYAEWRAHMIYFDNTWKYAREYPIRTQEYVENECRKVVDQIIGDGVYGRTVE